ncbi:MAG: metal-dependent transcriptional regulator [Cellulosilyticaceae bacterium]
MLSSSLETYLVAMYNMTNEGTELKSSEITRALNVPLKKTIQALQRLHYQKYVVYTPYQPLSITEKGIAMAKYLAARNLVIDEFLDILQIMENRETEKEAMQQYLSQETLQAIERFVIFTKQYPEIVVRYKLFAKRKPKVRLLEELPPEDSL